MPKAPALFAVLVLSLSPAAAQEEHKHRMVWDSVLTSDFGHNEISRIEHHNELDYTLASPAGKPLSLELSFDRKRFKLVMDGEFNIDFECTRDRFTEFSASGETTRTLHADKTPELREELQEIYGTPLVRYQRDAHGRDVKATLLVAKDAKSIRDGPHLNARLCHPPFLAGKKSWTANRTLASDSVGRVSGSLTYTPLAGRVGEGLLKVGVSGTLSEATDADKQDVRFSFSGHQIYDTRTKSWAKADLTIKVTFTIVDGKPAREAGKAVGSIKLTLETLDDPPKAKPTKER